YTAGAIASIAYGIKRPAVDGNVLRVITRICADETDIAKQSFKKKIENTLFEVMPADRPGIYNQALMELGALICVPNGPAHCAVCPVSAFCEAYRQGRTEDFPVKTPLKARTIEKKTVFLIKDGDSFALNKRGNHGLLAGFYEFPNQEGYLSETEAVAYLKKRGFDAMRVEKLPFAKHIFTHKEWHMAGYLVRIAQRQDPSEKRRMQGNSGSGAEYVFATVGEMEAVYPVPSAFAAYKKQLGYLKH
ncbi:MAG TPA: NUDIX domain-containing protein, partial [Lachnospiraceae bacterium]|nr:NUDIX domain-containing protein [Lachnospiraceae bacterium]